MPPNPISSESCRWARAHWASLLVLLGKKGACSEAPSPTPLSSFSAPPPPMPLFPAEGSEAGSGGFSAPELPTPLALSSALSPRAHCLPWGPALWRKTPGRNTRKFFQCWPPGLARNPPPHTHYKVS